MKPAIIVGNGTRQDFDLEQLRGKSVIFGCNALYRDFKPDYLVAIDLPIIKEVNESNFPLHRFLVPPEDERFEDAAFDPKRARSNAGMNAMREAIKRGHTELYCLGVDFVIDDAPQALSNVYDKTPGYELSTRASFEDSLRRVKYIQWFILQNQTVAFKFVFPRQKLTLHDIVAPNAAGIYYDDFLKCLGV